jgi:hypothetical protein
MDNTPETKKKAGRPSKSKSPPVKEELAVKEPVKEQVKEKKEKKKKTYYTST